MKNIKLHAIILALIVVAELIGTHTITIGIGRIVLLPMLFALLLGILTTPKFLNLSSQKEMVDASSLIGVTLMLLMARYGTLVGPTLPKILAASPALILQEFGNLGTVLLGVPVAVYLGLKSAKIPLASLASSTKRSTSIIAKALAGSSTAASKSTTWKPPVCKRPSVPPMKG